MRFITVCYAARLSFSKKQWGLFSMESKQGQNSLHEMCEIMLG